MTLLNPFSFKQEAFRLLREKWTNPTELAEELFAILQKDFGSTIPSQLTVAPNQPGEPQMLFRPFGDDAWQLAIRKGQDQGTIGIGDDGRVEFTPDDPVRAAAQAAARAAQGGGGGIPGLIKSGTGSTYQVDLYENGVGVGKTKTKTVSVTQLQIATDENVPLDSWVFVTKVQDKYYMQFPVWGAPPS